MPVDKKLVQQVRATATKPRNFFFVPGKDVGVVGMSARKLNNADIEAAKQETGVKNVIRGRVAMVNGELVFTNVKSEDKTTETKLRKTLKLNTGLTCKVRLVKADKADEVDDTDDDAQKTDLTQAEQQKMLKAEYKLRHTEVARQFDRLRELMPQSTAQLEELVQKAAAYDQQENYKDGLRAVEKLEGYVQKLMPGAELNSYKTRLSSITGLIQQLPPPLDEEAAKAAANFQGAVNDAMNLASQEQFGDALGALEALEPQVKAAIARAQGRDDGVGKPTDKTDNS
jgi:hypothetical protein